MNRHFDSFISKIPKDIVSRTRCFISDGIAIFQPEEYVLGVKVIPEDYHFVVFHCNSPVAKINNREFACKKGCFLVVEPGTDIVVPWMENPPIANYTSISIRKDIFDRIGYEATGKHNVKFKDIHYQYSWSLVDAIERLKSEMLHYGGSYPMMIESTMIQIVFQIIRDSDIIPQAPKLNLSSETTYLNKIVEYMNNFYNCHITLDEICRKFYLSSSHFQRMFKYHLGITPHQYLIDIRIKKAKDLLLKDHYSLAEVARLCGFVNQGHFSTIFKQRVGTSPSMYKKHFY